MQKVKIFEGTSLEVEEDINLFLQNNNIGVISIQISSSKAGSNIYSPTVTVLLFYSDNYE